MKVAGATEPEGEPLDTLVAVAAEAEARAAARATATAIGSRIRVIFPSWLVVICQDGSSEVPLTPLPRGAHTGIGIV